MEELGAFAHDFLMNPEPVAAIEWLKGRGVKTAILTNNFVREDGTTVFPTSCHNADVVRKCTQTLLNLKKQLHYKSKRKEAISLLLLPLSLALPPCVHFPPLSFRL